MSGSGCSVSRWRASRLPVRAHPRALARHALRLGTHWRRPRRVSWTACSMAAVMAGEPEPLTPLTTMSTHSPVSDASRLCGARSWQDETCINGVSAISDGTVRTLTLGLADPATAPRSGAAAGARPQVRTAPAPLASRRLPPGPSRASEHFDPNSQHAALRALVKGTTRFSFTFNFAGPRTRITSVLGSHVTPAALKPHPSPSSS